MEANLPADEVSQTGVAVVAPALAVRAGLRLLLNASASVEVIAEAATLADLQPLPEETDVLVLAEGAYTQPDVSDLRRDRPGIGVLFLVAEEKLQIDSGSLRTGLGYLPLESSAEELIAAVMAVKEGLWVGTPVLFQGLFDRIPTGVIEQPGPPSEPLTDRENQVLQLLAHGLANKQIALSLGISEHTVKFHISAIYSKLGASNRTEAVRLGVLHGLITL
jgi:two-component system, NarL family, response regulator YdfI